MSTRSASRRQPRDSRGHFLPANAVPRSLDPEDWDDTCHHAHDHTPATRPRLSLVKAPAAHRPVRALSLVKPILAHGVTRPPALPRRRPAAATPGPALAHAAHAATKAGIPAPILGWSLRPDGTAYQYLPDGTLLTHPGTYGAPITAITTCTHGAAHAQLVTTLRGPRGLHAAQESAAHCPIPHIHFGTPGTAPGNGAGPGLVRTAPFPRDLTAAFTNHTTTITPVLPLHQKPTGGEHISISTVDAVRDTPLIAGMQEGRANQYSDCANELRDVLDGEDPDGWEFGISVEFTATEGGEPR